MKKLALALAFIATPALSGTTAEVDAWDERCAYVPPRVACLSACAMAWVKSPERRNDGIIGIHRLGTQQAGRNYWTFFVVQYAPQWAKYLNPLFNKTDRSIFIVFEDGREPYLADWRDIEASGYEIVSTTEDVPQC